MIVTDTTLVTSDSDAGVTARALGDGHVLWAAPLPSRLPPLAAGTFVVVASGGRLVALDLASGKPKWTVNDAGDPSSLLWHNALVIAAVGATVRAGAPTARTPGVRTPSHASRPRLPPKPISCSPGSRARSWLRSTRRPACFAGRSTLETVPKTLLAFQRTAVLQRRRRRLLRVSSATAAAMGLAIRQPAARRPSARQ